MVTTLDQNENNLFANERSGAAALNFEKSSLLFLVIYMEMLYISNKIYGTYLLFHFDLSDSAPFFEVGTNSALPSHFDK